ncbi:hypothetical protein [Bacteroides sp. 519]|uniref:hypothetical protein n=1 Tax=Bacteroides sp. 519 TaxID=2302937 RepID=UPI0013D5C4F2|nr:hypothetical protein [Bacteroides sp. 519]NDV57505.1 hypothetical protein [Bacteroides sp. 519]
MKNLDDFSKFQLEKKQLNALAGGVSCVLHLNDGSTLDFNAVGSGINGKEAGKILMDTYGDLLDASHANCG